MRLESALYTSKSGLETHGQAIAVVGDNVANANTIGYKKSRAEFADIFAEGDEGRQSVAGPTAGNGVYLTDVRPILTLGTIEATEREFDVVIEGRGFLMAGDAEDPVYTRAGNLEVNGEGALTTAEGLPILGVPAGANELGNINLFNVDGNSKETTQIALFGNLQSDLPLTTPPLNPQTFIEIGNAASFVVEQGAYDSLGERHSTMIAFFKTGINTWNVRAFMDGGDVGGQVGQPVQVSGEAVLNFGPNGSLVGADLAQTNLEVNPPYAGGADAGNFVVQLGGMQQFAAPSSLKTVTTDGRGVGKVEGYEVDGDGTLRARLDTGENVNIGRIPVVTFRNDEGLTRAGATTFQETEFSGERIVNVAGEGGSGKLRNFALELSTVDISNEFVSLTLLQRGYQANSQTLNATSQLIRDTIQLMR